MDAARYRRLRDLVHAAADVATASRRAFLEGRAPDDPSLVTEALAELAAADVDTTGVAPPGRPAVAPGLAVGDTVDRYRLVAELGRGGMGVVFEAVPLEGGPAVALKAMHPALAADDASRTRFLREAAVGFAVESPHVVRVHGTGEATVAGAHVPYLVMERVVGRTLREALDADGPLPQARLLEVARQAARALAAVHAAGVVHRDLKPENLLWTDEGTLRLLDLGVVRLDGEARLTREGQFVGSLRYASPEQCAGRDVGPTSDLYALGVVLFELATGHPPFQGPGALATIRQHLETPPPRLLDRAPSLAPAFAAIVDRLLEKDPAARFPSAEALERALG
ncbi:MAG: serine/threonine protein kinase [Planctomycetes bacterium]|nr:serine/threonine protein kinase [Planctomycetota bacterium]